MNEQTRKALELAREALQRGDTYDREHAVAAIDAALSAPASSVAPAGWMKSGALLYRLTDDRKPVNRDEIRVTMADGSRTDEACSRRAGELFDRLAAAPAAPVAQPLTEAEAKLLLKKSDLLDMFLHIGWYSAPRKGFDEHGMALIRAIERAHGIGQGGAA